MLKGHNSGAGWERGSLPQYFEGQAKLEVTYWKDEPARYPEPVQRRLVPRTHDIVIVTFFSTMGSRSKTADFQKGPLSGDDVTLTEWEFEDALAGWLEAADGPPLDLILMRKPRSALPRVNDDAEHIQQELELAKVDRFFDRWIGAGWTTSPVLASHPRLSQLLRSERSRMTFETPAQFEHLLREHIRKLVAERLEIRGTPTELSIVGSPFRPYRPFKRDDGGIFFGRGAARCALHGTLERVVAANPPKPFLLVAGPSGVGKSSLVRCGLLNDLTTYAAFKSAPIREAVIDVSLKLGNLCGAIAEAIRTDQAFGPELSKTGWATSGSLEAMLGSSELDALRQRIGDVLTSLPLPAGSDGVPAKLVLVLDQLEAAFDPAPDNAADLQRALAILDALLASGRVVVVGTMRSDRLDHHGRLGPLDDWRDEADGIFVLTWPRAADFDEMIRKPLELAAIQADEELIRTIVDDAAKAAEALPLLQVALERLFDTALKKGRRLRLEDYEGDFGGLAGAIQRHADECIEVVTRSLPDVDVKALLERALFQLVEVRVDEVVEERIATMKVPAGAESAEAKVLDLLSQSTARLVVADRAPHGGVTYRLSHESLLRTWPRVRDLVEVLRPDILLFRQLQHDADGWDGTSWEDRIPGHRLDAAADLLRRRPDLGERAPRVRDLVQAAVSAREQRQERERAHRDEVSRALKARVDSLIGAGKVQHAWMVLEHATFLFDGDED